MIIAIDEAGRGPWAGPVTVGGVLINATDLVKISELEFLNDSKKISPKRREVLEKQLLELNFPHSIANIEADIIDQINILEATKLGVITVIDELISQNIEILNGNVGILIDGKFSGLEKLMQEFAWQENVKSEIRTVIDGDALCPSIAAASILAKEHRDRLMLDLHAKYPEYAFDQHKGYGTKLHMERLATFGPSEIHRKSFKPIKKLIKV